MKQYLFKKIVIQHYHRFPLKKNTYRCRLAGMF